MKLIIEANSLEELMDHLMTEIPMMYTDMHCKNKTGGVNLKWEIQD